MNILAFPLDVTEYTALALGAWAGTRTRGVFSDDDNLRVTANGNMTVTVGPGIGWLKMSKYWGVSFLIPESITLNIDQAESLQNRRDAVCVRLDKNLNIGEAVIKKGTPATTAQPPAIEQDTLNYDEIYLAVAHARRGATAILPADIEDTRFNENYCGLMSDGLNHIPTQQLYDAWWSWFSQLKTNAEGKAAVFSEWMTAFRQLNEAGLAAWILDFKNRHEQHAGDWYDGFTSANTERTANWYSLFTSQTEAGVRAWFQMLQDELDENQAVNLANMIHNHQQARLDTDEVHGTRLKDGKWQVDIGIGWATLATVPVGYTAGYFDALGFTAAAFDMVDYTAGQFDTQIEVEV